MKIKRIISTAEPFFFPGNKTGCLLIHGFTGSPKEMRWMGEFLNKKGYSVLGIRLAGHATQPSDLIRTRWWDWQASVEDGINLLNQYCKKIITIGLSMGGSLSLLAAATCSINGAIAMSSLYALQKDWRLKFAKQLSLFVPAIKKSKSDMKNRKAAAQHIDYPAYPIRSIAELNNLLEEVQQLLPKITIPVLLIHSKSDSAVNIENIEKIYTKLGSSIKTKLILEKSSHVITEDIEREKVFNAALDFIRDVEKR
ncbi:MAG TPA: alpha/beta fold hydrolase [Anaerolineae bacterium]|nr:alpha/beta fold hydrolase [Anaerolineae bacterium]